MFYYKIKIDDFYYLSSLNLLKNDKEIIQLALDSFILNPDDGDPFLCYDFVEEITKAEYDDKTRDNSL